MCRKGAGWSCIETALYGLCISMKGVLMSSTSHLLSNCILCPRKCGADRIASQTGYCGMPADILVARAALHMWEEPCISGAVGSGTVFFSGCNLKCVFCQNHSIALGDCGKPITIQRLAEIFLELQEKGAANINLVTPTHYIPQIRDALLLSQEKGLTLPIVYNTGSYENIDSLRLLEGLVDIYLPDLKYYSAELSAQYSHAADYFQVATAAIAEMYRQVGSPVFDEGTGMMKRGMIVRHLVLPGQTKDSKKVLRHLYETYGDHIYISIMNQYTPLPHVAKFPALNRRVTAEEYDKVVNFALCLGITNAFIQEGETAEESFIPPFNMEGV